MRSLLSMVPMALVAVLTGCTSLSVLSPVGVDLSGTWELDVQHSDAGGLQEHQPQPDIDERQIPHSHEERSSRGGLTAEPSRDDLSRGPLPRLPMLVATQMTIAQDTTSMGIDYPGQPYRDLKWGHQKRGLFVVDAGWDERLLVVSTASNPLRVKETYSLSDDGKTLTLRIDLNGKAMDTAHIVRVFTRKSSKQ